MFWIAAHIHQWPAVMPCCCSHNMAIRWTVPDSLDLIGWIHTLKSFISSIGTPVADSGLEQIMESTFDGVSKMLSGKKYPQNIRALRMIVEELLRSILSLEQIHSYQQLLDALQNPAEQSCTTGLWMANLIKLVFITMLLIRAEWEGNWPLHFYVPDKWFPIPFIWALQLCELSGLLVVKPICVSFCNTINSRYTLMLT